MPNLVNTIAEAWRWVGFSPRAVIDINAFGNTIIQDADGRYWRICPEELSCEMIATNDASYAELRSNSEFLTDWNTERLRAEAAAALGVVPEGRCYCFKIPTVLGGEYALSNIGTISLGELLSVSGGLGRQIADLPDGAKVRFKIVD